MLQLNLLLAQLFLAASLLSAATNFAGRSERRLPGADEISFIGWNDSCSAALRHLSFPTAAAASKSDPDIWRVGTISLAPDSPMPSSSWSYDSSDPAGWLALRADEASRALIERGYSRAGHQERMRPEVMLENKAAADILMSSSVFKSDTVIPRLSFGSRLDEIYYSPLGSCALLVYKNDRGERIKREFFLIRVEDPGVRRVRAKAHLENSHFLFQKGDLKAAEGEAGIATGMDPGFALALYQHAAMLSELGQAAKALTALKEALRLSPSLAVSARTAPEFEPLKSFTEFKKLMGTRSSWIKPAE